jgi:hypothetical protein
VYEYVENKNLGEALWHGGQLNLDSSLNTNNYMQKDN